MMMIPNTLMGINSTPPPPNLTTTTNTTTTTTTTTSSSDPSSFPSSNPNKRKRRPAGTPDPDAEVVSLSPKTLLESDRYVCEICNQGFQRDQNLQMHRRRHKVPWKLLKRDRDGGDTAAATRKRVYVCPEPSCLHHDPGHALGDLVGIKKHFRRKHSDRRQWVCERCGKGYAVQSDYKAHLKTCGTRGHSCDCGRVFSRVESFIEHQDACNMGHLMKSSSSNNNNDSPQKLKPQCLSSRTTASSPSPSSGTNSNPKSPRSWWPPLPPFSLQPITLPKPNNIFKTLAAAEKNVAVLPQPTTADDFHNLDLQLSSSSPSPISKIPTPTKKDERFFPPRSTRLRLSIGGCDPGDDGEGQEKPSSTRDGQPSSEASAAAAEKAYADEARRQARRQIEMAEKELADAKRMRKQAQAELEKARAIKERAREQIKSVVLEITCNACKQRIQGKELAAAAASLAPEENSLVLSYVSSAVTEGEVDDHNGV